MKEGPEGRTEREAREDGNDGDASSAGTQRRLRDGGATSGRLRRLLSAGRSVLSTRSSLVERQTRAVVCGVAASAAGARAARRDSLPEDAGQLTMGLTSADHRVNVSRLKRP